MLDDVPCCNRHQTHSNIKSQCHFCCCFKGSYWLRLRSCLLWDQIRLDSPINTSDYFPKSFRNQTQAICHSLNNSSQSLEIELFDHFFGFFSINFFFSELFLVLLSNDYFYQYERSSKRPVLNRR